MNTGASRPRVLVFAYACEPGRGSEPGAGWGMVRALSTFADCTVLVGPEHMPAIRTWEAAHPHTGLTFIEVPESWPVAPSDRHRLTRFLLYLAWLRRAKAVGGALHRRRAFDATWHATYSVYWLPTPAVDFGVPCVWGPVGGAVTTPPRLRRLLGWRGLLVEWMEYIGVRAMAALPATRAAALRASVCLVQNDETRASLPRRARARAIVMNHAVFTEPAPTSVAAGSRRRSHALFVGALEARKGAALAIQAIAYTPAEIRLRVIGDGPERGRLERLAVQLGVGDRVEFLGRLPRAAIAVHLAEAAAVVSTGLREEGGLALAEALLAGAPVAVVANGGARTVAAAATDPARVALVPAGDVEGVARGLAASIVHLIGRDFSRGESLLPTSDATAVLRLALADAVASGSRHAAVPRESTRAHPHPAASELNG